VIYLRRYEARTNPFGAATGGVSQEEGDAPKLPAALRGEVLFEDAQDLTVLGIFSAAKYFVRYRSLGVNLLRKKSGWSVAF
jgi:hypothetical protein